MVVEKQQKGERSVFTWAERNHEELSISVLFLVLKQEMYFLFLK